MKNVEPFDWQSIKGSPIIGVDEVGRGCLAGPVYASAVVLGSDKDISYLTDSKKITPKNRQLFSDKIKLDHFVGVGFATPDEISQINILQASLLAMFRAVSELKINLENAHILVDGTFKIPQLTHVQQTTLIKGDLRAAPVSAASIIAKVERDNLLISMSEQYPEYGFEKHKGYCTKVHKEAIKKYGPCEVHRKTFAGVKEYL